VDYKINEIRERGYCVLRGCFARAQVEACGRAFRPVLMAYLESHGHEPNRGPHRHFLPMPFDPPCFAPEFFFDGETLGIVRGLMGERIVADQWGCDAPAGGSEYQKAHVDYQRPLFSESPDLALPVYMLVVSFGLAAIALENGPIEIAPGTHRMAREEALRAVEAGEIGMEPVALEIGDVLIRHPWALHRGSPNRTEEARALVSIRYVRQWYADGSREVNAIPRTVWEGLAREQREMLRFPVGGEWGRTCPTPTGGGLAGESACSTLKQKIKLRPSPFYFSWASLMRADSSFLVTRASSSGSLSSVGRAAWKSFTEACHWAMASLVLPSL